MNPACRAVLTNFPPQGKLSKAPMSTPPETIARFSHLTLSMRLVNQGIEKLPPFKICRPKTPLNAYTILS